MTILTAPPAYLHLSQLSDVEQESLDEMLATITARSGRNTMRRRLYDARNRVRDLGISIPPQLKNVEVAIGWPGMVCDVLEERLDWDSFTVGGSEEDLGVDEIVDQNQLDVEAGMAHIGSLIYGVSFLTVGSGADGEPNPLVTVESPMNATLIWDPRLRRATAGIAFANENETGSLYFPNETLSVELDGSRWRVTGRDRHNLGRVLMARMPNRPDVGRVWGRSEITPAIVGHSESAVRTLLGAEVAREFYGSPQRYLLGADETAFEDGDGNMKTGWEAVMGVLLAIPDPDDDPERRPTIGDFKASSPTPYLDLIRGYAQLVAAEAGMPASYLGFATDNPSSADAIRAGEARLVKRAERRQRVFGAAWTEAMRLALMVRDSTTDVPTPKPIWRDASTPTRAAAADEAVKLVTAGILPADSEVTLERLGLSETEKVRVLSDRRRADGSQVLEALRRSGGAVNDGDTDDTEA